MKRQTASSGSSSAGTPPFSALLKQISELNEDLLDEEGKRLFNKAYTKSYSIGFGADRYWTAATNFAALADYLLERGIIRTPAPVSAEASAVLSMMQTFNNEFQELKKKLTVMNVEFPAGGNFQSPGGAPPSVRYSLSASFNTYNSIVTVRWALVSGEVQQGDEVTLVIPVLNYVHKLEKYSYRNGEHSVTLSNVPQSFKMTAFIKVERPAGSIDFNVVPGSQHAPIDHSKRTFSTGYGGHSASDYRSSPSSSSGSYHLGHQSSPFGMHDNYGQGAGASNRMMRPNPPTLQPVNVNGRRVQLHWNYQSTSPAAASFKVYRDGAFISTTHGCFFEEEVPEPATSVTYRVVAVVNNNESSPCEMQASLAPSIRPENFSFTPVRNSYNVGDQFDSCVIRLNSPVGGGTSVGDAANLSAELQFQDAPTVFGFAAESEAGTYRVSFSQALQDIGEGTLCIRYKGAHIPGSPFSFTVVGTPSESATTITTSASEISEKDNVRLTITPRTASGITFSRTVLESMSIQVVETNLKGEEKNAECSKSVEDSSIVVSYTTGLTGLVRTRVVLDGQCALTTSYQVKSNVQPVSCRFYVTSTLGTEAQSIVAALDPLLTQNGIQLNVQFANWAARQSYDHQKVDLVIVLMPSTSGNRHYKDMEPILSKLQRQSYTQSLLFILTFPLDKIKRPFSEVATQPTEIFPSVVKTKRVVIHFATVSYNNLDPNFTTENDINLQEAVDTISLLKH